MSNIAEKSKHISLTPEEITLLCNAEIAAQTRRIQMLVHEIDDARKRIINAKNLLRQETAETGVM